MFEISGEVLYLKANTTLDFETNPVLDVIVAVDDSMVGSTPDDAVSITINVYVDTIAPAVELITRLSGNPVVAQGSVDFLVTFSEAVASVDKNDFALTAGSNVSALISTVSGNGNLYIVTVTVDSGQGTLRLDVPASATIRDLAANPLAGLPYSSGEIYTEGNRIFVPLVMKN